MGLGLGARALSNYLCLYLIGLVPNRLMAGAHLLGPYAAQLYLKSPSPIELLVALQARKSKEQHAGMPALTR